MKYKFTDRIQFGKYNGKFVSAICYDDPSYIKWCIKNEVCEFEKKVINSADNKITERKNNVAKHKVKQKKNLEQHYKNLEQYESISTEQSHEDYCIEVLTHPNGEEYPGQYDSEKEYLEEHGHDLRDLKQRFP